MLSSSVVQGQQINTVRAVSFSPDLGTRYPNMGQTSEFQLFCMVHIQYFLHAKCIFLKLLHYFIKFSQHKMYKTMYQILCFRLLMVVVLCSLL